LEISPSKPFSTCVVRGARREHGVRGVQRQVVEQVGAGAGIQGQPLVDERAVQARILARTQNGVEHVERRLIGSPGRSAPCGR
jgi:hypothetical protein